MRAKVWFLGGGPGACDLLTVRAARVLGEADVVIWGQFSSPASLAACGRVKIAG